MRYNKVYVTHGDEGFLPYLKNLAKSVSEFSNIPIIVYLINSDKIIDGPNIITEHVQIDNNHKKLYEVNKDGAFKINNETRRYHPDVIELFFQKPKIIKHALENYADEVCYLDGDSIATPNIDRLFEYGHTRTKYPISNRARWGIMQVNGKGNPWEGGEYDISKCLEYPACTVLGADISNRVEPKNRRLTYIQTGYIVSHINHLQFYDEWISSCYHPEFQKDIRKFLPYHEETIYNVVRWKYNYHCSLPYCYIEMSVNEPFENIADENNYQKEKLNNVFYHFDYDRDKDIIQRDGGKYVTPGKKEDICVLHGKTLKTYDIIMKFLRNLVVKNEPSTYF